MSDPRPQSGKGRGRGRHVGKGSEVNNGSSVNDDVKGHKEEASVNNRNRTKAKRPEVQRYVPRGRRLQNHQEEEAKRESEVNLTQQTENSQFQLDTESGDHIQNKAKKRTRNEVYVPPGRRFQESQGSHTNVISKELNEKSPDVSRNSDESNIGHREECWEDEMAKEQRDIHLTKEKEFKETSQDIPLNNSNEMKKVETGCKVKNDTCELHVDPSVLENFIAKDAEACKKYQPGCEISDKNVRIFRESVEDNSENRNKDLCDQEVDDIQLEKRIDTSDVDPHDHVEIHEDKICLESDNSKPVLDNVDTDNQEKETESMDIDSITENDQFDTPDAVITDQNYSIQEQKLEVQSTLETNFLGTIDADKSQNEVQNELSDLQQKVEEESVMSKSSDLIKENNGENNTCGIDGMESEENSDKKGQHSKTEPFELQDLGKSKEGLKIADSFALPETKDKSEVKKMKLKKAKKKSKVSSESKTITVEEEHGAGKKKSKKKESTRSNITVFDMMNMHDLRDDDKKKDVLENIESSPVVISKDHGKDTEEKEDRKEDDEEEDTWDTLFDDDGECLDPSAMDELTKTVGKVKIEKATINYLDFKPKDPELSYEEMSHVIEIFDFPPEFKTEDLLSIFSQFKNKGFDIKWVDDTHALGVFSSPIAAQDALKLVHPLCKVGSLSEASKASKIKAKRCTEFLQPYKPRPETTAMTARRLVTGALGIAPKLSKEQRDLERKKLREAKEKKRNDRKQRNDIWEGTVTSNVDSS